MIDSMHDNTEEKTPLQLREEEAGITDAERAEIQTQVARMMEYQNPSAIKKLADTSNIIMEEARRLLFETLYMGRLAEYIDSKRSYFTRRKKTIKM